MIQIKEKRKNILLNVFLYHLDTNTSNARKTQLMARYLGWFNNAAENAEKKKVLNVIKQISQLNNVKKRQFMQIDENSTFNSLSSFEYVGAIKGSSAIILKTLNSNINAINSWELIGHQNIVDIINIQLLNRNIKDKAIETQIASYFNHFLTMKSFKIQAAFGMILQNKESARYWRPSHNNAYLFTKPKIVQHEKSLSNFLKEIKGFDVHELAQLSAPSDRDSSSTIGLVTNLSLYIYKSEKRYGALSLTEMLPTYISSLKSVHALIYQKDLSVRSRKHIDDKLCLFRCIALGRYDQNNSNFTTNMSIVKWIKCEKRAKELYTDWAIAKSLETNYQTFKGVLSIHFNEIAIFFAINLIIYQFDNEENRFRITFESEPKYRGVAPTNVLLVNSHFMYIKDVLKLTKDYYCKDCKKSFIKKARCQKHEQECNALSMPENSQVDVQLPPTLKKLRTVHHLLYNKSLGLKTKYQNTNINIFRCLAITKLKGQNASLINKKEWQQIELNSNKFVKLYCEEQKKTEFVSLKKDDYDHFCRFLA